jgi:hypothetical protein
MNSNTGKQLQIAVMRARAVAKASHTRAVEILLAAGVALQQAIRFVFSVLREQRGAAAGASA